MKDKRKYPRVNLGVIVNYSDNINARAKNISEGRACQGKMSEYGVWS